jgi:hypothetical protein
VLLDALFGPACFRNEVNGRYRRWPAVARQFQKMHDVLLFYSKSAAGEHKFQTLYGYESLAASTLKTFGTNRPGAARLSSPDGGSRVPCAGAPRAGALIAKSPAERASTTPPQGRASSRE